MHRRREGSPSGASRAQAEPERPRTAARGLALGTVQWGMRYGIANRSGVPDRDTVADMLQLARESGVHELDSARAYGQSENLLGSLIADDPTWTIVTKLAPDVFEPGRSAAETLARTGRSLASSRRALRRKRLDVLLLHRSQDRDCCGGVVWRRLRREREQDSIGALGASARTPGEAWSLLQDPSVEVIQVATSLLDQRLARTDFFERAQALGRRIYVRSIFLQGVAHLASSELPESLGGLAEPLHMIRQWASLRSVTPREVFLGFARRLPGITPVVGCERPTQLLQILHDWRASRLEGGELDALAARIPNLGATLLDPSRWPAFRPRAAAARQAIALAP